MRKPATLPPILVFCFLLFQFGCVATAQPPAPLPGPGPVSPAAETRTPPTVSSPPEKPVAVPIGRSDRFEEEKQKEGEISGSPPGTIQQDPAARRRREGQDPSGEK